MMFGWLISYSKVAKGVVVFVEGEYIEITCGERALTKMDSSKIHPLY